jgi:hypothetical protein
VGEGAYLLVVRKPTVILVAAATLGLLGAANLLLVEKFFDQRQFWRIKFVDDLALFVRSVDRAFGIKSFAVEAFWLKKADVRVEPLSESWLGKDVKVNVCRGAKPFIKNAKIRSEMLGKFETLLRAI